MNWQLDEVPAPLYKRINQQVKRRPLYQLTSRRRSAGDHIQLRSRVGKQ